MSAVGQIEQIVARIQALEAALAAHELRIAALERSKVAREQIVKPKPAPSPGGP